MLILLALGAGWPAAGALAQDQDSLRLARRLVDLKPLDYSRIARIMEIDCLEGVAGTSVGNRLDLQETKQYCRVAGEVFWSQVKDQVREAMAQAYARYLTQRELEVIIEGLLAERQGKASSHPPGEIKAVVAQLRRVDPGIKAEVSWQVKEIVRRWKERFSLDSYFKDDFRRQVMEGLPWKIRSKIAY
ncbi:MAG: hypothetical protein KJ720_16715 [Proteobacteria bacterium]|nr:hypothetical protein [Pseudomonadota bacterium]MBU1449526.1 hypothetical protein [Pseudomonadota bacterium]MBU2469730.1 hypothetical protein [Pseudomonadota bacterium]MBU2517600.1 hypothetical protein [Pseudomonadota bacterium]